MVTFSPEAKRQSILSCFWYLGFELTALANHPPTFLTAALAEKVIGDTAPSQLLSQNSDTSWEGPASSPCFPITEVPSPSVQKSTTQ